MKLSLLAPLLPLLGHALPALPQLLPPRTQFVQVNQSVRLEVLDWGGSGKTMVLLAGGGNTAHVFDDFAPKLAVDYHVIGITRRGFGASSFSPASGITDYADDVLAVLDTLKIARAFILGHSIAGAELTSIGVRHPERIAGLIYIEAAYPYAFREPHGPTMQEFSNANAGMLQPPTPLDTNLASFRALQRWDARTFGFQMPESEFRQTWDSTPGGRPVKPRDAPGFAGMMTMLADTVVAAAVPVPALVMFAIPKVHDPWMDARDRKAATEYYATIDQLAARQADAIQKNQPNSRVSRLRGMHYLFLSNAADVLRAIRAFSATFN